MSADYRHLGKAHLLGRFGFGLLLQYTHGRAYGIYRLVWVRRIAHTKT